MTDEKTVPVPTAVSPEVPPPRIRWAGVVWGSLFAAFGITTMAVLATAANRLAFAAWVDGLGPWGAGLVGLVAVGALVLILGVLGAVGRLQRRA